MIWTPYNYQQFNRDKILDDKTPGLLIDMGMGKTVVALTAVNELLFDRLEITKPLIIAPKKVAEAVWSDEIEKWDHLKHLKLSKIMGTEKQRKQALAAKADVYIISCDSIVWLVAQLGGAWPFDMCVIDESSKFKNPQSKKFKALRQIRPKMDRVVILTGSPTPNGMEDLWSQIYLLDMGERLGKTITEYRENYFNIGQSQGHIVYNYKLKKGTKDDLLGDDFYAKLIMEKVSDICVSMKSEDYLDLPKRIDQAVRLEMSPELRKQYNDFERNLVLSLDDEEEITAMNAAVLTNKLLQFANGAVYAEDKTYREIHNEKIEALIEVVEEANGQPIMVFYQFNHDIARIHKYLKKFKPVVLTDDNMKAWNRGEIPLYCAHPASASHGLNLQYGGHLLTWFGRGWNMDNYVQGVKRLDRPGQEFPVINKRIVMAGTMDEDVEMALQDKIRVQDAVLLAVKARIEKYKN